MGNCLGMGAISSKAKLVKADSNAPNIPQSNADETKEEEHESSKERELDLVRRKVFTDAREAFVDGNRYATK